MSIFESMESLVDTFTKSERKIYLLIKKEPHSIEEYTISRIAAITGTSKSAVLRFCQKLGFSGYSEFRFTYTKELYAENTIETANDNILTKMVDEFKNLTSELVKIDEDLLLKVVNLLNEADLIRSVGFFNSSLPARKLMYDFIRMGKSVITIDSVIEANSSVSTIKENDVIVIFSVSGRIDEMKEFVHSAKKKSAIIIVVTCNIRGSLTKVANEVIVLPTVQNIQHYNIDAQSFMLMFVNILTVYYKSKF